MSEAQNPMQQVRIDKLTINAGTGKSQDRLEKTVKLIKQLTGTEPVKCLTNKKIAAWGLRPGLPIGCKLTLRGKEAAELLDRLLYAKDYVLKESCFDNHGNVAFGIHEYIDVKDARYEPSIGMLGFQVTVTLGRPGFRVKRRSVRSARVGKNHDVSREDAVNFLAQQFKVKLQGKGDQ